MVNFEINSPRLSKRVNIESFFFVRGQCIRCHEQLILRRRVLGFKKVLSFIIYFWNGLLFTKCVTSKPTAAANVLFLVHSNNLQTAPNSVFNNALYFLLMQWLLLLTSASVAVFWFSSLIFIRCLRIRKWPIWGLLLRRHTTCVLYAVITHIKRIKKLFSHCM